jgi:putative molybdopterin biosynthesis protein
MTSASSRLKGIRGTRALSVAELAIEAGVARQTIYAIEHGSFVPNTLVALKLARALGVSVEDLFSLQEKGSASTHVNAELLTNGPELPFERELVRIIETGDGRIAVPAQAAFSYLPRADGVLEGRSGRKFRVSATEALAAANQPAPVFIAGCDPALSLMAEVARSRDVPLIPIPASSNLALKWLSQGKVHIAGSHLLDRASGDYNIAAIRHTFPKAAVTVLTFAEWETGLITKPGNPKKLRSVADLPSRKVSIVNREKGSGARVQLDSALRADGIPVSKVQGYERVAYGHLPAAFCVASGWAECCIATRSAALCFGLHFVPLRMERFDLIFTAQWIRTKSGEAVADLLNRFSLRQELAKLAGYQITHTGKAAL